MLLEVWKEKRRVVIGVLHIPALPGAPGFAGDWRAVCEAVRTDAEALTAGGVDGLMLENFGDAPFYPNRVPAHTVAHMTRLAVMLRETFAVPLGINVLRNDGVSAMGIAAAVEAQFIRVNVLCGARVADQGLIQGIAHDLLRERALLGSDIKILADVDVKHSAPLAIRPLEEEVHDLLQRGGADAVIVSGAATGKPVSRDELNAVKHAAGDRPVLLGSGVTALNLADYAASADGLIVGTAFKRDGVTTSAVDVERVRSLMKALQSLG